MNYTRLQYPYMERPSVINGPDWQKAHIDTRVPKLMRFDTRPDTSDAQACKEVIEKKGYLRPTYPFMIEPGESWLDIGANIGTFSVLANAMGASCIGFEPDATNAALARHNLSLNGFTPAIMECAVVGDANTASTMELHLANTDYGVWRHSLYKAKYTRTVAVPVVNFSSLLYGITGVKLDAEGAEMDIIEQVPHFAGVNKFVFEYHFDVDSSVARFRAIIAKLQQHFAFVRFNKIPADCEQYTFFPPARIVFCYGPKR